MPYNIRDFEGSISIQKEGADDEVKLSFFRSKTNLNYTDFLDHLINETDTLDGDVPDWLQEDIDERVAQEQLENYTTAIQRLAQYRLATGREEITEEVVLRQEFDRDANEIVDITITNIVQKAIEPVTPTVTKLVYDDDVILNPEPTEQTIENPLITQDDAERQAAQDIIDATPQSIIDAYGA